MANEMLLGAIKAAMKGELDSVAVYEGAAAAAEGEVRDFFLERASARRRSTTNGFSPTTVRSGPGRRPPRIWRQAGREGGAQPAGEREFSPSGWGSGEASAAVSAAVLLRGRGCAPLPRPGRGDSLPGSSSHSSSHWPTGRTGITTTF
ncbi:MAG: hypothetical protein M0C28_24385 [Candidatus Moduliflexus flocculans]|nr:hypothetical protein [Candidatus Moduliflexus flocculans]